MSTTAKPNTQPIIVVLCCCLCCLGVLFVVWHQNSVVFLPLGNFEGSTTWSRLTARSTIWHVHDTF